MRKDLKIIILVCICGIIAVSCVTVAILKSREFTVIDTSDIKNAKNQTLSCSSQYSRYPFFEEDDAIKNEIEVKMIFSDDESLKNINLRDMRTYDDENSISYNEARNHIAMNQSFYEDGLGVDALNMTFSKLSNALQMNLYVDGSSLNAKNAKYFLITAKDDRINLQPIAFFADEYRKQNFICTISE